MRTDGMWKNSCHLGSARRLLPGVHPTHRAYVRHNNTYQQCPWIWTDPEVYLLDPGERLGYLWEFYNVFIGEPTLCTIDDSSALAALTKKKICCHCLLSRAAMQSNLSGSSRKNTTPSWRTCASRRAGFVCFTAKLGSKTLRAWLN